MTESATALPLGSAFELDGAGTVRRLRDDVVPLLGQHLGEVHPDQGLVLGDHDAGRAAAGGGCGVHGHRVSTGPWSSSGS